MKRIFFVAARQLGLLLVLTLFVGCSTFHQDWRQAAVRPATAGSLEGCWEGRWLSDRNGHAGRLRCIVTKETGYEYEFHYWATFWKIFRSSYTVHLHVQKVGEGYAFKGAEDLGRMAGGVYEYEGKVNGTNFSSTYKSQYDHGTFRLTRVP